MAEALPTFMDMPAVSDLNALDDVRDALMEHAAAGAFELRLGAVERISTNALLMILAAVRHGDGPAMKLGQPSEAFLEAVDVLGLKEQFAPLLKGTS